MVVYENYELNQILNIKKNSIKLFTHLSEVSALPAGCMNQSEVIALPAGCT